LGALEEVPRERLILHHVAEEQLPLDLERVAVGVVRGNTGPVRVIIDRAVDVRVPDAARRRRQVLGNTVAQTGNRRAVRAIDLKREKIVATNTHRPGGVEVTDHAVLQLERSVRRVVGRAGVGLALLVPALRDVRGAEAAEALDFAEEVLDHVLPVAEHVHDDAAVVFLAVVPRRALQLLVLAREHPVAELAANRENLPEDRKSTRLNSSHVKISYAVFCLKKKKKKNKKEDQKNKNHKKKNKTYRDEIREEEITTQPQPKWIAKQRAHKQ